MILHRRRGPKGKSVSKGQRAIDSHLVIELTRELVRFPSVNPPGNEAEVASFLAGRMRELGLEAETQTVQEGRSNVIGRLPGGSAPPLVFTGHVDVVPPGNQKWEHPPFDAELVDGRIYGRGSADMKGGVAAIVAAMSALNGSQLDGDVILAATCGEEAGMVGARAMVERGSFEPGGRLVVAEPTDLNVFHGEKGVLWLKVRALGRTAHGSMPHLGINAINAIATLIPRLNGYPFPYEESALLGKPSLSVNVIQGGNKINVIPDFCEIEVDMRTIPGQDHAAMTDAVRKLADDVARDFEGLRMEIDVISDVSSLETDSSHELVLDIVKSVRSVRGADPEVGGVAYATDGAHLGPGFNMPVVICGPGAPGMAHQPDEYVETQQLTDAAEIYVDLALRTLVDGR